jgi:hypothetical protein
MDAEYPAAHSMDTLWYAIDRSGHVGHFSTGENGHLPEGAEQGYEVLPELYRARLPGEEPALDAEDPRLGLFVYTYSEGYSPPNRPYERAYAPEKPLHVDELQPGLRARLKRLRFEALDFARSELVQPLEFFPCSFWYDSGVYLCGDGRTVRPVPGQEHEFAQICQSIREQFPELAGHFRFEGHGVEGGEEPPATGAT